MIRGGSTAVELDGYGIVQRYGRSDGQLVSADFSRDTAACRYIILVQYMVFIDQRDGVSIVYIVHSIGLGISRAECCKARSGIMGRHIRQDAVIIRFQIGVARVLLGHSAGIPVRRVAPIVKLSG